MESNANKTQNLTICSQKSIIFKVYFMQYRVKSQLYFLQNFVKMSLIDFAFFALW